MYRKAGFNVAVYRRTTELRQYGCPQWKCGSFERAANGREPLPRLLCRAIAVSYDDIRFAVDSLPSDALLSGSYKI